MPLRLLPASASDAPAAAAIEKIAYGPNPLSSALFPGGGRSADSRVADLVQLLRDDAACRWVKVVDPDLAGNEHDGMVAFAMWYVWDTPREDAAAPPLIWGPGTNPDACDAFFGGMKRKKEERFGGRPHIYLKLLHTDPAQQRRGAGSMLLQWGIAESKRLGLPAYLEASEEGRPLYEKHGWRAVDTLVVDFSKWGGPAKTETMLMLREPSD